MLRETNFLLHTSWIPNNFPFDARVGLHISFWCTNDCRLAASSPDASRGHSSPLGGMAYPRLGPVLISGSKL
jgi:hypothetical protein